MAGRRIRELLDVNVGDLVDDQLLGTRARKVEEAGLHQLVRRAASEGASRTVRTEIREAPDLYYAEDYHQQYLAKNPNGYCGLGGTGVSCPIGLLSGDRAETP